MPNMPNQPGDEDAADVAGVLAGDGAAFSGIVRRWQSRLVNLAWRFCRDRMMAEDLAQEAFVKAFRALPTFRGDSSFSTWLTAIAMNTYRSGLRDRPLPTVEVESARSLPTEPDAYVGLHDRERAEMLRRAVRTLPMKYREPIVLYYFEEMDLAETARILAMPEGTLKARLHRGRELLRRRSSSWFGGVESKPARSES
jgi:RNA polymerase sigma-70 factor, ECF subfamily